MDAGPVVMQLDTYCCKLVYGKWHCFESWWEEGIFSQYTGSVPKQNSAKLGSYRFLEMIFVGESEM